MNVFVPIQNIKQMHDVISCDAYAVILSTAFCSVKTQAPLSRSVLTQLANRALQKKVPWYLSVNRMILQSEWKALEREIVFAETLAPTGYIVSDLGVMHYLKKYYPDRKIVLQTDTTITQSHDTGILLSMGADLVVLARELTLDEITEIVRQYPNHTAISAFGYQVMSTSSRPLLSNYFQHIHKDENVLYQRYTLQEEGRMERYPAMQDEHGFHIFAPGVLEIFDEVRALEEVGMKNVMIDTLFIDDETVLTAIQALNQKINPDVAKAEISKKYPLTKALYYTATSAVKVVSE